MKICEMTCAVMGCRPTKPKNSVADENADHLTNGNHINDSNCNQVTNGNKHQDLSKVNKRSTLTVPSNKELSCTQSQLDFFEMLDKKIDSGRDYNSKEDLSRLKR